MPSQLERVLHHNIRWNGNISRSRREKVARFLETHRDVLEKTLRMPLGRGEPTGINYIASMRHNAGLQRAALSLVAGDCEAGMDDSRTNKLKEKTSMNAVQRMDVVQRRCDLVTDALIKILDRATLGPRRRKNGDEANA